MYFITSKTRNEAGQSTLLSQVESRANAREMARTLEGTVRTQAEYDAMLAAGQIAPAAQTEEAAPIVVVETVEVVEGPVESMDKLMTEDEDKAVAELQNPILEAARKVADAPKIKRTVGAKGKAEPKRVVTSEETLKAAERHLRNFVQQDPAPSKVQIVREMAAWNGNALQRRDVFAIIAGCLVDLGIAAATISTQFQLQRAGKAPKAK